jgi:hypothetical protein
VEFPRKPAITPAPVRRNDLGVLVEELVYFIQ